MNKKISILIHLVIPLFAIHLVEEIKTGFYQTDQSIKHLSQYTHLSTEITFLSTEIVLFMFLGFLLFTILRKKQIPLSLLLLLSIISIYEFTHTLQALKFGAYTPGVITGTLIGIAGLMLLYTEVFA